VIAFFCVNFFNVSLTADYPRYESMEGHNLHSHLYISGHIDKMLKGHRVTVNTLILI